MIKYRLLPLRVVTTVLFFATPLVSLAQTTVYSEDFNSGDGGWSGDWVRDASSFSGNTTNHWHSTPFNNYGDDQDDYVTSGTIDLSTSGNYTFSVSIRYNTEAGFDGFNIEYSDNGGAWTRLGSTGSGTNWYNYTNVNGIDFNEHAWSDDNGGWQTASYTLPAALDNNANVKFRFHFGSDFAFTDDGVAFDDIVITSNPAPGGITTNLMLWLKADAEVYEDAGATDAAETGDAVQQWNDKSGNGNNVIDVNAPNFLTNALNFNPAIDFDGVDDYLQNSTSGFYTEQYYIVFIADDAVSSALTGQAVVSANSVLEYDHVHILGSYTSSFTDEVIMHAIGGSSDWRSAHTGTTSFPASSAFLMTSRKNAGGTGTDLYNLGVEIDNNTANSYTEVDNTGFTVGAEYTGLFDFDGKVAEVISYSARNSDADKNKIESYLAIKYGITLGTTASTVNYSSSAGTTIWTGDVTYQNDVAGVGQDDNSALSQLQSLSINSDAIVTATVVDASIDDGEYVLWGNDDAAKTLTTTFEGESNKRLTRVWKVIETGSVGDITISIPTSVAAGLTYILIANTPTMSVTADLESFAPLTVNGSNYEATINFTSSSSQYFTFTSSIDEGLPVELTSFSALQEGSSIVLQWQTATEVNNYGFEIERQVGSKQSAASNWEMIGFIEGHGNSNSPKQYSFSDKNLVGGSLFKYRLKQIDTDGKFEYSEIIEVELIPLQFTLFQNYPNPFNPETIIKFTMPKKSFVSLKVFDILGSEVATLINEEKPAGTFEVTFSEAKLASGIYIYRLAASGNVQIRKMTLSK